MASLKGNFFRFLLRKTNNLNPLHTPDAVSKIRKLAASSLNDQTPKGFVMTKYKTPSGTAYERVVKEGAPRNGNVVLYLHGGAYISGLLSFYRNLARDLCDAAGGAEMIFLDYHLSPEYKYPTQLNEAFDLWQDLLSQGYQAGNIIIGGDSAGGNLTLALILKLRDEGYDMPRGAFLISPWADTTGSEETFYTNYGNDVMFGEKGKELTPEKRKAILESKLFGFIGDADRKDPYVSPVYGDYHGFPPMFFTTGGHEMLLSDTLTIIENAKSHDIRVECDIQPEMFHIYAIYGNFMPESKISYGKMVDFIRGLYKE